jgi:death on curing protein
MNKFVWIDRRAIILIHEEQLAEHGGGSGLRDASLLDSALMRAKNIATYDENADIYMLAAAYAFGLAKNHAFIDGNKRTAFVAMRMFLLLNSHNLISSHVENVVMMLKLAGGDMSEDELVAWLRANVQVVQPSGQ